MIRNDKRNLTSKGGTFLLQEELSVLENFILEIATEVGKKKRNFDLDEIYNTCTAQLSYSKEEIVEAIKNLYKKKFLIKHHRITKLNVLDNENRQKIFDYIEENPGAHVRELRDKFNLGAYEAFRNLEFLELFELIRSKKFSNKIVYFITDFDKNQEDNLLVFKNKRTKMVYDQIISNKRMKLSEISKNLNLDHGQIQPHLQKLLDYNLIDSILENNITYYVLHPQSFRHHERSRG